MLHCTGFCKHLAAKPCFRPLLASLGLPHLVLNLSIFSFLPAHRCSQDIVFIVLFYPAFTIAVSRMTDRAPSPPYFWKQQSCSLLCPGFFTVWSQHTHTPPPMQREGLPFAFSLHAFCSRQKERFAGFFHATVILHLAFPLLIPIFLLVNSYSFLKTQIQHPSLVKPSLRLPYLLNKTPTDAICPSPSCA